MRILVVGGDATGMSAASQAKRRLGDDAQIHVFELQSWTSYSACGIPYWIGGQVADGPQSLVARSPQKHRANGLEVWTGAEVTAIDTSLQEVTVVCEGKTSAHSYDHLIYATGSVPLTPPIPGLDLPGVYRAQTLDDGIAAIEALERHPTNAVVLGAGYIGLEMAEAARDRGLHTTVLDLAAEPMRTLDPDMGELVRSAMESDGVVFRGDEAATEIVAGPDGRVSAVRTAHGEYPAEIVFLGLGVRPRTDLAAAAGLPLGEFGGVLTDDHQRVQGFDNIWSGGDCTEVMDRVAGVRRYVPLGTHANHHGRVIGLNLAGESETFPGVLGTAITKFQDTEVSRVGLREAEAAESGFDAVAVTITAATRAGYMPGVSKIHVKLIGERGTGRILGCQIVGGPGAGKRIDAVAVAIWNEMTAAEFLNVDLAYAPPFSPVWDPVLTATRRLLTAL